MYAIACACCCAAIAGRVVDADIDIDIDVGKGGSWLISYFISNGGGGRLSVADGELELPRARDAANGFEREGENIPRFWFNGLFAHDCGVFPLAIPMGVKPVESGGHAKLLYDGIPPWLLLLRPFRAEDIGLRLSPGTVVGGVKRFPTLTDACAGCVPLIAGKGWYFCANCCPKGAGSSKVGKLFAAGLRDVKLEGAPADSKLEAIPGCCCTAAVARLLKTASRLL